MIRTIHLIDQLALAEVTSPGPHHVAVQPMTLLRDSRMALFQHPDSTIEFTPMRLGQHPRLVFACGLKQVCWTKMASPVTFRILVRDRELAARVIFSMELDPRNRADHRKWREFDVELTSLAHEDVSLIFQTSVPHGAASDYCWAGWADPRVTDDVVELARTETSPSYPLVIFITADALRPDFLGCYGNAEMRTPNIDQLARDGALFRHARAQTGSTVGSYCSMLTGAHPLRLGTLSEWSSFPAGFTSLPAHLRSCGFHTLIAASEAEVGDPGPGFTREFDEQVPCLARPAQDGSITTRQFIKWLDRRPNKPCFAWIEYFDTHPPATPPEPYRSMYYQGDPSDARNEFMPEAIAKIRGIESVLELLISIPLLERGVIDTMLRERLRDVVSCFEGRIAHGPDLAEHLEGIGEPAMNRRAKPAFTAWLAEQVRALDEGIIPAELITWLKDLLPQLREIEMDILSWLDGIVDYRYPVSQYKGCVSHLDDHVGRIMAALKERGLYDSATIVFTSPHGELFGEHGIYFHHHLLAEQVLRVPMIIKPATGRAKAGTIIDGIMDIIDLFPTTMQALDLPAPPRLDGVGRWAELVSDQPIPPHDSFAADIHEVAVAVVSGDDKLIQAVHPHHISPGWTWVAGDRALFDLRDVQLETTNRIAARGDVASVLSARLSKWQKDQKAGRVVPRPGLIARIKNRLVDPTTSASPKAPQHG
jgi:arylsulfatase A-like enzyme